MLELKLLPKHMINFILVVNMIEQKLQPAAVKRWNAAKTENAPKKVMMVKIAVKKMGQLKWIAARMGNVPKKDMTVKTAAKMNKIININFSNSVI